MKSFLSCSICALIVAMFLCGTAYGQDQEQSTEIQGYYQTYRNFSFKTGVSEFDLVDKPLKGGGFTVAQNLASWFAIWTQLNFYGSVEQPNHKVRIINNLQGVRYQTKKYGPLQLYGKGGMGFSHYSMNIVGNSLGEYKFSAAYGAGAQLWITNGIGLVFDMTHTLMGLPNLTDLSNREKWDSGLTFSTGFAVRF